MSQIEVGCPLNVIVLEQNAIEIQFDTLVYNRTYIFGNRRITIRNGYRLIVEQVGCFTVKILYCTIEAAAEQFKVKTGIECM